jgi:hypothetical protein
MYKQCLGRRQKEILSVLADGKEHHVGQLMVQTAIMEVRSDGRSADDAQDFLNSYDGWWRVDNYASMHKLISRGLLERTARGFYRRVYHG